MAITVSRKNNKIGTVPHIINYLLQIEERAAFFPYRELTFSALIYSEIFVL